MAQQGIVYCCNVCKDEMTCPKPKSPSETLKMKPLIVTKCGHLFHPDCLHVTMGGEPKAWGPKNCPVCKTTLAIPTDVIRVFPCNVKVPEEKPGESVEELQKEIAKLTSQIKVLSTRLEISFLKYREAEKNIAQARAQSKYLATRVKEMTEGCNKFSLQVEFLLDENKTSQSTITSLRKELMDRRSVFQNLQMPTPAPPGIPLPIGGNGNPGIFGSYPQAHYRSQFQIHNSSYIVPPPPPPPPSYPNPNHRNHQNLNWWEQTVENNNNFSFSQYCGSDRKKQLGKDQFQHQLPRAQPMGNNVKTEDPERGSQFELSTTDKSDSDGEHYWKYRCGQCNLIWGRSGEEPQTIYCKWCRSIASPFVKVPIAKTN